MLYQRCCICKALAAADSIQSLLPPFQTARATAVTSWPLRRRALSSRRRSSSTAAPARAGAQSTTPLSASPATSADRCACMHACMQKVMVTQGRTCWHGALSIAHYILHALWHHASARHQTTRDWKCYTVPALMQPCFSTALDNARKSCAVRMTALAATTGMLSRSVSVGKTHA